MNYKTKDKKSHKGIPIIRKILTIPLIGVFLGIVSISYFSSHAIKDSMLNEMKENGIYLSNHLTERIADYLKAQNTINTMLEDKIRVAALAVIRNKDSLNNELLLEMADDLGVDELHWFNRNGVIIYSTVEGYLNWETTKDHPLYVVLNGQEELMEDIRKDVRFGKLIKYGAVRDTDGTFVQVGISADHVRAFTDQFNYQRVIEEYAAEDTIIKAEFIGDNRIIKASSDSSDIGREITDNRVADCIESSSVCTDLYRDRSTGISIYEVIVPVNYENEFQGILKINYSMTPVNKAIASIRINIEVMGGLLLAVLSFLLYKVQISQIANPIISLNSDIQHISLEDNINYRLPVKEKDPFVLIRETTNGVLEKVQSYFESMVEHQEELVATYEELEATMGQLMANEEQLKQQYDEINEQKEYIEYLAEHDPLTKLYNRRKFVETLQGNLNNQMPGAIILMDIDNFKYINDTLGHIYGDKVLEHVAHIIKKVVNDKAEVYRIGGDEFVIDMEKQTDPRKISACIEAIVECLQKGSVIAGIENHITLSYGIVCYPRDGIATEDLLMKADVAMYSAKKSGKNRYLFYHERMTDAFGERVHMENMLRKAVEEEDFHLLYQPIICTATGKVDYFEALIRLNNQSMSPGVFIPVAEESGLIISIGRWVIQEVIKQLKNWRTEGHDLMPVSINLSPKQVYDETLVEFLITQLNRNNIEPSLLEIEVTENVLIDNRDYAIKTLQKIKEIGIRIALDDFGTGYSSFNYLTFLPVSKIKLDKSLMDKFVNMKNAQVMSGLITVAHGLNLMVVAEGVETREEVARLKQGKCDYLQGYLFSKPITAKEAEKLMDYRFE